MLPGFAALGALFLSFIDFNSEAPIWSVTFNLFGFRSLFLRLDAISVSLMPLKKDLPAIAAGLKLFSVPLSLDLNPNSDCTIVFSISRLLSDKRYPYLLVFSFCESFLLPLDLLLLLRLEEPLSLIWTSRTCNALSSASEPSSADLILDNYLIVLLLKSAKFLTGINLFLMNCIHKVPF